MLWDLNRANTSGVGGGGVAAAGGGRREVRTHVVSRNVMNAWIHRNVGVRVSAMRCVDLLLILSFIVTLFA
jgi:hypothetical protein